VVRPYWLVDNIEAAIAAAVKAGGEIAHPPMEIPSHGTFANYIPGPFTTVCGSFRRQ
jgi:predicted enzyme related to lactoylglutathione lyase